MRPSPCCGWEAAPPARPRAARWRLRAGAALVALVLAGLAGWHRLTDEARLARFAEQWLSEFTGGEVRVEQARFGLWRGLTLRGVTVATPAGAHFDPGDASPAGRTVLKAGTLFVPLRPFSMLAGRPVVSEIVALETELTLVRRLSDGRWNWQILLARRASRPPAGTSRWPALRVRDMQVAIDRLDERGRQRSASLKVWVDARPKPDRPGSYDVEMTALRPRPAGDGMTREMSRFEVDMTTMAVAGSLPSLALGDVLRMAPPPVAGWLDAGSLTGEVRPESFRYSPRGGVGAKLAVRDAGLSLPVTEADRSVSPERRFLRFDGITGTVRFDEAEAAVALAGRFRSQPVTLNGTFRLPQGGSEDASGLGFDLDVVFHGLRLPRDDDAADPAQRRFVRSWALLAEQVRDFDGRGDVDVRMKVRRQRRAGAPVELVEGAVDFKGCSARYVGFPYRLEALTGRVWIRPDGRIELQEIVGRHGGGTVEVKGLLGGRLSQEGDLDVAGRDIVLDEALLACLDERERDLIQRFRADVRADVQVRMRRPATPLDEPPPPWRTEIGLRLTDGSICLEDFPYPLDHLTGRMRIGGGRLEAEEFCARHGPGRVCIAGVAEDCVERGFRFDLRLDATGVAVDEVLGRALPAAGRRLFDQFRPSGTADVNGRLFASEPGGPVRCDLRAALSGASLAVPDNDERITEARAVLRIQPERIEVESLAGRFGPSPVEADGRIPLGEDDAAWSMHVRSERAVLDDRLRSVLPAGVRAVWDSFHPEGITSFDARFGRGGASSQPAAAGPAASLPIPASRPAEAIDYTVTIEPVDGRARYEGFPLPLSGISGRFVITPGRVLIDRLHARHGDATIEGVGAVETDSRRTLVALTLDARGLLLSEELRQALPWRLRRLWNDIRPAGRVDLTFDRFLLTRPADGQATWSFEGSAALHDASLTAGSELTEIEGRLRASGEMGRELSFAGDLDWSQARVGGWKVTDLKGAFMRSRGEGRLRLSRLAGRFCQGRVIGEGEVRDSPQGAEYGLTLTVRDMSLGDFMNARPGRDGKGAPIRGTVDGNLSLAGRFGDMASRRGGGTVLIHHAEIMKVPFMLAMMQVVHLAPEDDNAFQDARLSFVVDGDDLLFQEIDLRGRALSMVGAGRVNTPTEGLDLILLAGSPVRLPRVEVLSELIEGVARELVEVHVEGTVGEPSFRADLVRSMRRTVDAILTARQKQPR